MNFLEDLLGANHQRTFSFFLNGLREITERKPCAQMLYVATVLAHYAQTSRYDSGHILFMSLGEVFDRTIFARTADPKILEIGGSHVILFAGFFRSQVRGRHNVEWYDQLGQDLYYRVSRYTKNYKEQIFFDGLSETLPNWNHHCYKLCRKLAEDKFVLRVN